jgi:competence protein ComEC
VVLRILGPDSAWTARQTNANEASVVLLAEYRGARFLLTGDAEREEEEWLVEHWGNELQAHVLKLGHHGSRTSSSAPFLDAVSPLIGLASVGAANRYGHPAPETLLELVRRNIPVLRSDREGSIVISSDGRRLEIASQRERWSIPIR